MGWNQSFFFLSAGLMVSLLVAGCRGTEYVPDEGTPRYEEAITSFYVGLAALQAGEERRGREFTVRATELAPGEPAAWANLGVLNLRQRRYEEARDAFNRAHELAPDNAHVEMLLGYLASVQGEFAEATARFRRASELDPQNLKAIYALALELERQGTGETDVQAHQVLQDLHELRPQNLAVMLELARLSARLGDAGTLREIVERLQSRADAWPEEVREQLQPLAEAAVAADPSVAGPRVAFLRNVLVQTLEFRQDLAEVETPVEEVGEFMLRLIRLPSPSPHPSVPDFDLSYSQSPAEAPRTTGWTWAGAIALSDTGPPSLAGADQSSVHFSTGAELQFPGRAGEELLPGSIVSLDFDYDFLTDVALAGSDGFRLYSQVENEDFVDVTNEAKIPEAIVNGSYLGLWAADVDLDGDLDLVLAAEDDRPVVLRNNNDGTFTPEYPFDGVSAIRDFIWADLTGDGAADAAMIDSDGNLHVFINLRGGHFSRRPVPDDLDRILGIAAADISQDGTIDIVAVEEGGTIIRLTDALEGTDWSVAEIAELQSGEEWPAPGTARILIADLDNNGGLDLLVSYGTQTHIWLSDEYGALHPLRHNLDIGVWALADIDENGMLDLVGLCSEGRLTIAAARGTMGYHGLAMRPRGARSIGDQRINPFGVGGEMEIRSGLLYQKQIMQGPIVHFGLGERTQADVVRIIWPNGSVQAEFELESDQQIFTEQRLKGSCPFVFTFDGDSIRFVTDFLWRSPLGLAINAQESAGVVLTEDWIRIRDDQLAPNENGFYDVRITADLWETHYFDYMTLKVIDHPRETDIFVDERFAVPPPEMKAYVVSPPQPVTKVWDDRGNDVTETVSKRNGEYLDFFGRGRYQGVTRDHYVEIELGDEVPRTDSLLLVGYGWVRPTDSSVNVAMSQGDQSAPQGLRLDVLGADGEWWTVHEDLGFPAGKTKTVLIDLDGVFDEEGLRRMRLHTNLEVYWDALEWAVKKPDVEVRSQRLLPDVAEIRYRGFNVMYEANESSPELALYEIEGTTQRWRDLTGYYTRYGDVRELLERVDDRYVIMNAGDELLMKFEAPPPPPEGWMRSYILIGDGWNKDGDYNTRFSRTVLPLPSHDDPYYDTPPARLVDDPVYQRFPEDWQNYHTRYVTPERFRTVLRPEL